MRSLNFAFLALATAALTACGGGGDAPAATAGGASSLDTPTVVVPSDVADKYAGTWVNCTESVLTPVTGSNPTLPPARLWIKETLTFTKTGDTTISGVFTQTSHTIAACADNPGSTFTSTDTSTFVGTTAVGGAVADKILVTPTIPSGPVEKAIAFVSGNLLKVGDDASTPDADGFPTTFDPVYVYTKQP